MLDNNVITSATTQKYTEFSDTIKAELGSKMTNHPDCIDYADQIDKINSMKTLYTDINNLSNVSDTPED
jgi:hypothetical protein